MHVDSDDELDPWKSAMKARALVHIRIKQRNAKKKVTTVEGLATDLDLARILQHLKRTLKCNGTVIDAEDKATGREYQVIQLQGDHREAIKKFLVDEQIVEKEDVKLHGG